MNRSRLTLINALCAMTSEIGGFKLKVIRVFYEDRKYISTMTSEIGDFKCLKAKKFLTCGSLIILNKIKQHADEFLYYIVLINLAVPVPRPRTALVTLAISSQVSPCPVLSCRAFNFKLFIATKWRNKFMKNDKTEIAQTTLSIKLSLYRK